MDVTVYLPDDMASLVARAKAERGLLSRLLRDALSAELERRDTVSETLDDMQEIELDLEDKDGAPYIGRFTGALLEEGPGADVYLTDDGRVLLYDPGKWEYSVIDLDDYQTALAGYPDALRALGITPVVDI